MIKNTFIFLSLGLFSSVSFGAAPEGFVGFESRVNPRIEKKGDTSSPLSLAGHVNSEIPNICQSTNKRHFIGWNYENPSRPSFASEKESVGEKMDSIIGHYLDGRLMSKQEFKYTETGRPLVCRNYLPNSSGSGFQLDGYYSYEYDNKGRLISAEKVSATDSSMRVEYIYDGDSPVYSTQIAYLPDAKGNWIPYQKGEYTADINLNTTSETFYLWTSKISDWMPVMKNEATYDEMSRLTSYFPYVWDASSSKWVGNKDDVYEGQRFSYTQNGEDAQQIDFTWENDAWLEYRHIDYTYNTSALLTIKEEQYWNREKQDWSGGDGYGQWGDKKYNSKDCFEYDEYGRVVLNNFYRKKKTEDYVNNWRAVYEYNELGDGITETVATEANIYSDGSFNPERRTVTHNTENGAELYYAVYRDVDGTFAIQEEEFRYLMPVYHWYLGYESFRYENGEKIPVSKEEFIYADDFDPSAGYETPIEGRHYVKSGEDLVLKTLDQFTWGPRDVMIAYVSSNCLSGIPHRVSGWDVEYDFSADCSKIFMWPDANKGSVFYENKNLSSNTYYNPEYEEGSDEWNKAISNHLDYYYSSREESGVEVIEQLEDIRIIDRFDIFGHRLTEPTQGINIIVYSDGTSIKTMVK